MANTKIYIASNNGTFKYFEVPTGISFSSASKIIQSKLKGDGYGLWVVKCSKNVSVPRGVIPISLSLSSKTQHEIYRESNKPTINNTSITISEKNIEKTHKKENIDVEVHPNCGRNLNGTSSNKSMPESAENILDMSDEKFNKRYVQRSASPIRKESIIINLQDKISELRKINENFEKKKLSNQKFRPAADNLIKKVEQFLTELWIDRSTGDLNDYYKREIDVALIALEDAFIYKKKAYKASKEKNKLAFIDAALELRKNLGITTPKRSILNEGKINMGRCYLVRNCTIDTSTIRSNKCISNDSSGFLISTKPGESLHQKFDMILSAKKSIYIHAYTFEDDVASRSIFELLKEKKMENPALDIVVSIDGFSANLKPARRRYLKELESAGIIIHKPIGGAKAAWNINSRRHDKILVIDRQQAIIGSSHFSNKTAGYSKKGNQPFPADQPAPSTVHALPWIEQDIALSGSAAEFIARDFESKILGREESNENSEISHTYSNEQQLQRDRLLKRIKDGLLEREYNDQEKKFIEYLFNKLKTPSKNSEARLNSIEYISFNPRNGRRSNSITRKILEMISSAKDSIVILQPYFYPTKAIINALAQASINNPALKITIVTNFHDTTDNFNAASLNQTNIRKLIELANNNENIKIYKQKSTTPDGNRMGQMHSKMMIVDDRQCIIGSYNFHPRSDHTNSESVVYIDDPILGNNATSILMSEYLPNCESAEPLKNKWGTFLSNLKVKGML